MFPLIRPSLILDDLDDIFSDELAQIDGLMDARKNRGEEMKKRIEKETEDLKEIEKRVNNMVCIINTCTCTCIIPYMYLYFMLIVCL